MAMYEYRCVKCGEAFEKIIRSPKDTKGLICPSCGSRRVKKQISRFAYNAGAGDSARVSASECATSCGCGGGCACGARGAGAGAKRAHSAAY